jgi:hypothetical protein
MVTLTFGILGTFFDLSCPEVRIPHTLLSDNAYLFNQAQGMTFPSNQAQLTD